MATTPGKEQQFQDEAYFVVTDTDDGSPATYRRVPASNLPDLPALTSRFRPVFNVKGYGVTGDGVTNDRAAIQAVMDAAGAVGGVVYFPAGTYLATSAGASLYPPSGVTISGDGPSSILKDAVGNYSILALSAVSNVVVENIAFTGSGTLGTAGRGAVWLYQASQVLIRNIKVDAVGTCGVAVGDSSYVTIDNARIGNICEHGVYFSNSTDCRAMNCQITGAGQAGGVSTVVGIKITGGSARCRVDNCLVSGSLTEGIILDTDTDSRVAGCFIKSNTQRGIRLLSGSTRAVIFGNTFQSNATAEIRDFGSTGALILGNTFITAAPTASVIILSSGSTGCEVRDNEVVAGPSGGWTFDVTGTSHRISRNRIRACDYGVVVRATSTSCLVANNDITAAITAYSDSSGTNPLKVVTGSRGANAALASLLTQLAALGLIVDSSS